MQATCRWQENIWHALSRTRCRAAAERLVRSAWAQQRIRALADALLRSGTLSGEEIRWLVRFAPKATKVLHRPEWRDGPITAMRTAEQTRSLFDHLGSAGE